MADRPLRPVDPRPYGPVTGRDSFTFAVAGDGRPTVAGMPFPQVTSDIMRELALLRPAFTLYTGDAIFGYKQTRQQMLNELDRFRALAGHERRAPVQRARQPRDPVAAVRGRGAGASGGTTCTARSTSTAGTSSASTPTSLTARDASRASNSNGWSVT